MSSPDNRSEQEEKWKNLSAQKCIGIYDVLEKLQRAGALPEGKTADDPSLKIAGNIMDYAERVLGDSEFWASIPEQVPTRLKDYKVSREELKTQLTELVQESR